jgi:hypothetical protein
MTLFCARALTRAEPIARTCERAEGGGRRPRSNLLSTRGTGRGGIASRPHSPGLRATSDGANEEGRSGPRRSFVRASEGHQIRARFRRGRKSRTDESDRRTAIGHRPFFANLGPSLFRFRHTRNLQRSRNFFSVAIRNHQHRNWFFRSICGPVHRQSDAWHGSSLPDRRAYGGFIVPPVRIS